MAFHRNALVQIISYKAGLGEAARASARRMNRAQEKQTATGSVQEICLTKMGVWFEPNSCTAAGFG